MPFPVYMVLFLISVMVMAATIVELHIRGRNLAITLFISILGCLIAYPVQSYHYLVVTEETAAVSFINGKAVISDGTQVIWLSVKTGESYVEGDSVSYKLISNNSLGLDWVRGWNNRMFDIKTIRKEE